MKKGFTLIELIIIIAILGLLAVFTYPKITGVIENSKIKARERTIESLKESLNNYLVINADISMYPKMFQLSTLVKEKYLKDKDIIDPVTNNKINGCLYYRWDHNNNQYIIEYKDNCNEIDKENYVKEKYPDIIYGDVNLDSIVNNKDNVALSLYLEKMEDLNEKKLFAADVNLDGVVDDDDNTIISRHANGWPSYQTLPYHGIIE